MILYMYYESTLGQLARCSGHGFCVASIMGSNPGTWTCWVLLKKCSVAHYGPKMASYEFNRSYREFEHDIARHFNDDFHFIQVKNKIAVIDQLS